jgi:signal transduction histidine kinase
VSARRHDDRQVLIAVEDNGPGIPAANREGLFEPFVSGKPTGMGLGLAVSQSIAVAHGGQLQASTSGRGLFHLFLPCVQTA